MQTGSFSNADVDTIEDVAEIAVGGLEELFVTFTVGTAALSAFEIQAKPTEASGYVTWFSTSADYTTPRGRLEACSGDLTIAGTTGIYWFVLKTKAVHKVKLRAAGNSSVVAGEWGAS